MVLNTANLPEVLTPEQAAEYLQVSRETIYRYIHRGQLMAMKLGRIYRIPRDSLELLAASQQRLDPETARLWSEEEFEAYMAADELDDHAREIIRRFEESLVRGRSTPEPE